MLLRSLFQLSPSHLSPWCGGAFGLMIMMWKKNTEHKIKSNISYMRKSFYREITFFFSTTFYFHRSFQWCSSSRSSDSDVAHREHTQIIINPWIFIIVCFFNSILLWFLGFSLSLLFHFLVSRHLKKLKRIQFNFTFCCLMRWGGGRRERERDFRKNKIIKKKVWLVERKLSELIKYLHMLPQHRITYNKMGENTAKINTYVKCENKIDCLDCLEYLFESTFHSTFISFLFSTHSSHLSS